MNCTSESNFPTTVESAWVGKGFSIRQSPSPFFSKTNVPLGPVNSTRVASRRGKSVKRRDSLPIRSVPGTFFCRKLRVPSMRRSNPVATRRDRVFMQEKESTPAPPPDQNAQGPGQQRDSAQNRNHDHPFLGLVHR